MSVSTENFVKTIFIQKRHPKADTRISTIAGLLHITNAAATDMARKLGAKELVHYAKYNPLHLTSKGEELAQNVIRKHRLWETFLYQILNLSLLEIHREAENLEHLTSDFLADKMADYLGYPTTDPHGDPIPCMNNHLTSDPKGRVLSDTPAGSNYVITRLFSSDEDFFHFCTANQLEIGSVIAVEQQYSGKKITQIRTHNRTLLLHKEFTDFIYVEETPT
ncbi:MAG: metal-dependent transcriptional regulator [Proteiniphilum sp.]|nr:metal-dependent transcriptional regulator [Proteiniphilum sp.]MDD4158096.1 metal-dependent transcriptional regulator [Proteiniphilum sp.]MDD4800574.1 metal-dependent transcriptional regulator [Proteiniphilum sp.]